MSGENKEIIKIQRDMSVRTPHNSHDVQGMCAEMRFTMQQTLEIRDNFGNKGTLTFQCKEEKPVAVTSVAMDFSRMIGVLETLGSIPDNSYYRHKMDVYCWAEEFVHDKDTMDAILFFEKKLKEIQKR